MEYGFVRVGAAVPPLKVANCSYNTDMIIDLIDKASSEGVQILVFPELSITGYTCGDLFQQRVLLSETLKQLDRIIEKTKKKAPVTIVGLPLAQDNQLFNCAAVISGGKVLGVVPKTFIPG
ncbi:MAG TPA: nitrilase-related carbon-nitrogen hydrolase, partial [Clostridia bacterium]